eukprot:3036625-Rhodomonas_salina.3
MRIRDVSTERLVAAASTAKSNAANRLSGTDCPGKDSLPGIRDARSSGLSRLLPRCTAKQSIEEHHTKAVSAPHTAHKAGRHATSVPPQLRGKQDSSLGGTGNARAYLLHSQCERSDDNPTTSTW